MLISDSSDRPCRWKEDLEDVDATKELEQNLVPANLSEAPAPPSPRLYHFPKFVCGFTATATSTTTFSEHGRGS